MDPETPTDPFDVFMTSINDEDVQVQISSIQKLHSIAETLGTERTRSELIPFFEKLSEKSSFTDDELLYNVAEKLGDFLPYVGGADYCNLLLNILENLVVMDEKLVREAAIISTKKIISQIDDNLVETLIVPLIYRLDNNDSWFTSKCAAVSLIPDCYTRVQENSKIELKNMMKLLLQNESPFVRRVAASNFSLLADKLDENVLKEDFFQLFDFISKDDEELVRMETISFGICLIKKVEESVVEKEILTPLLNIFADQSWKVRYHAANYLLDLMTVLGENLSRKYLFEVYQNLATDFETEVRDICAKNISLFYAFLQNNWDDQKEETLDKVISIIQKLYIDPNPNVRESASVAVSSLTVLIGKEKSKTLLLPIIIEALENESRKNKENIVENLNCIIRIVGVNENGFFEQILDTLRELLDGSSVAWRTRKNLLVTINFLAISVSKEYFEEKLQEIFFKLLNDQVFAIRRIVPTVMPKLLKIFGLCWTKKVLIPEIVRLAEHPNYLYRYVSLFCMEEMVRPSLSSKPNKYLLQSTEIDEEKVNTLRNLNEVLSTELKQQWIRDSVKNFEDSEIPNDSLKTYIENTFDCYDDYKIWDEDFNQDIDNIYIVSLLKLTNEIYLKVLRKLAKDKTMNIKTRVGSLLLKIMEMNSDLKEELNQNEDIPCKNEEIEENDDVLKKTEVLDTPKSVNDDNLIANKIIIGENIFLNTTTEIVENKKEPISNDLRST